MADFRNYHLLFCLKNVFERNQRKNMRLLIKKIIDELMDYFLKISAFILKKTGYKTYEKSGRNNYHLNLVNFSFLIIYCVLSLYNCYKTTLSITNPSYLVFAMNTFAVARLFIGHRIKIHDLVKNYAEEANTTSTENFHIKSTSILSAFEALTIFLSLLFILFGRFTDIDLLGIPSLSITSGISVINILFIGVEGYMDAIINMFQATPKGYAARDSEQEGSR